jgi:3-hydroxyacyl-CoA dehydrogenase/enoyl-CoA hydratase/3-hydroxybutyryl-CoA epimerase
MLDCPVPLTQFRLEPQASGLVHLVFDCPGRTMNVFSNRAIHELGEFAEWLHSHPMRGVVIRSGKASGFCAGADLGELGAGYDMIQAAAPADRFDVAFDHFFPLSRSIRRLETAGTPVAAVIQGIALGGGCELAMGAHHRVMTNHARSLVGLPECAVGLLPGGGGTQRLPRLVAVDLALDVLLLGRTLDGAEALEAGLADQLIDEAGAVTAAEAWLLSDEAHSLQPWDRVGSVPLPHAAYYDVVARHRARELDRMLGHEPAPLAILDCVECGLMQPLEGAIRSEMSIFAHLIQRQEPRNMIRVLFQGKQAFEKAKRAGHLSDKVLVAAERVKEVVRRAAAQASCLRAAGFCADPGQAPLQQRVSPGFWFQNQAESSAAVEQLAKELLPLAAPLTATEALQLDYLVARDGTVPPYLGGLSGVVASTARPNGQSFEGASQ